MAITASSQITGFGTSRQVGSETPEFSPESNFGNDSESNSADATISNTDTATKEMWLSDLGHSLPASATGVLGIMLSVRWLWTFALETPNIYANHVDDDATMPAKLGSEKSDSTVLSDTINTTNFGGASDLWGFSPSVADVEHPDFGFLVRVDWAPVGSMSSDVQLYRYEHTVYYEFEPTPGNKWIGKSVATGLIGG